jgi:hypothetical protein
MPNGHEGKPLAEHLVITIRKLRLQRWSLVKIANLVGCSPTTVEKYTQDIAARFREEKDRPEPGAYDPHSGSR